MYYKIVSEKTKPVAKQKTSIVKSEVGGLGELKDAFRVAEVSNNMPTNSKYNKSAYNNGTSVDTDEVARRQDVRLVKLLYTAVNETMMPYVEKIVDEYEYVGSPVFSDDGIDRESLAQMVSAVINLAANDIDEIAEINNEETTRTDWNRKQLLNNIVEGMVLNEIFMVRRPKYRRIKQMFMNKMQ